ncbi:MAG: hypothetical protein Q8Q62_05130 [Mesorhizobium sp.]|nr:hypothetical protein [Mesorhizobium sp.]
MNDQAAADAAPAGDSTTASTGSDERRGSGRQAIVIVHGMGEQRPLETLRSFVEAVWGGKTVPGDATSHNDMWLVPDTRAGLKELARVTTRQVHGVATDFYELYWADKLTGNTLAQFNAWLRGLLLRWPHQVPRETAGLWLALWLLTLAVVAVVLWVGKDASWQGLFKLATNKEPAPGLRIWGSIALAAGLLALSFWWLRTSLEDWATAGMRFFGTWQDQSAKEASLPVALSWAACLLLPAVIGVLAYFWFPWASLASAKGAATLAAIAITAALTGWVVPVLGDVARYVRTSPDAVSARSAIRERGLELLRALHGPRRDVRTFDDSFGDERPYDRVVVVGHSLGSIIAYDILRLFWQERGPTSVNPPDAATTAALVAIDAYCRECRRGNLPFEPGEYRRLQAAVSEALQGQPGSWRVTDFVTLGSPLSHAEFLISRDRHAFEQRKAERLFPVCPPMLEPERESFLYSGRDGSGPFANHAALFSATRWANIFDAPFLGVFGDYISGPCRSNFGPGVVDVAIRLRRRGLFSRVITHTNYWDETARGEVRDEAWKVLSDKPLDDPNRSHISVLRIAMGLKRRVRAATAGS